jgi:hypothetical protein
MFGTERFVWKGLDLHHGKRKTPVLTLLQDATYSHLYRIRHPNGWTSKPANLTRAKDAAYGHANYLLAQQTPRVPPHSPEEDYLVVTTLPDNNKAVA